MRRTGCIISLAIAAVLIGAVVYLASGLLGTPDVLSTRDPQFRKLVSAAPDEASVLAVAEAGPFWTSLRGDELLGTVVAEQSGADLDLAALLLGRSGLAVWQTEEGVGFATDAAGLRRQLVSLAASLSDSIPPLELRDGMLVSRGGAGSRLDAPSLPEVEGIALIRHGSSEEAWPPLDPPVVTAITRSEGEPLILRSVAHAAGPAPTVDARFPFEVPLDAAVTASFWAKTDALEGISKILPIDLGSISENGVALSVWDVETDGLLPQIRGVVVVPRTARSQEAVSRLFTSAAFPEELGLLAGEVSSRTVGGIKVDRMERLGMTVDAATVGSVLVVAFDSRSMDLFLRSERRPQTPVDGQRWRVVADVENLTPILSALGDDRALRLVARDFQRTVGEFESVLRRFRYAQTIEADRISDGRHEILEMRLR